jgi:hypothetical protein
MGRISGKATLCSRHQRRGRLIAHQPLLTIVGHPQSAFQRKKYEIGTRMFPSSAVAKKFSETELSSGSAHFRTFKSTTGLSNLRSK